MLGPTTALLGVGGVVGTSIGVVAQAVSTATDNGTSVAPYVAGSGIGGLAVAGLLEVLRRLLNGRLISRETRDIEAELTAGIAAAGQREAQMMRYAEQAVKALEDNNDELRRLRRMYEERSG